MNHFDEQDDALDDEPECRVCRGPAELPDRPLRRACKCSGSIGLVHQDCLQSWLSVMARQTGTAGRRQRCELCHYAFKFAPLYAPGTPSTLPVPLVLFGLLRRGLQTWLPRLLKVLFCLAVWLGAMPLLTAHCYWAWTHRPSALLSRLSSGAVLRLDWVGGLVVAALIIVSFLSLMNFADFVRAELQPQAVERRHAQQALLHRQRQPVRGDPAPPPAVPAEDQIDNELWVLAQQEIVGDRARHNHVPGLQRRPFDDATAESSGALEPGGRDYEEEGDEDDGSYVQESNDDEEDDYDDEEFDYDQLGSDIENDYEDIGSDEDDDEDHFDANHAGLQEFMDDVRQLGGNVEGNDDNPNDPNVAAAMQEDPADLDLNIALDEILGVNGPLAVVLRNLMWLLAFNAIYLGIFVFTPRIFGMATSSIVFNATSLLNNDMKVNVASLLNATNKTDTKLDWRDIVPNITSPVNVLQAVEVQSLLVQASFRLSDVLTILLGYLTFAMLFMFINFIWLASERFQWLRTGPRQGRRIINNENVEEVRGALEEFNRILGGGVDVNDGAQRLAVNEPEGMVAAVALTMFLKGISAVVKIGMLLLLKMFFLPISLGFCLDAATLTLLKGSLEDRIQFAGTDLFSFMLLHWVGGITFMLLVTVSVLQLREVMHPAILAHVVRPQEPQPNLLANLLHESVATHIKRMAMSLIVYAGLLAFHIYLPIRLAIWFGFQPSLNLSFVLIPQLQIPLELLFFHLCMLGLLEKNKNIIGEVQHHWLKFMGYHLGMIDCMLPRTVNIFRSCGKRNIFIHDSEIDLFWHDLAKCKGKDEQERLLRDNMSSFAADSGIIGKFTAGTSKPDGSRVMLPRHDYIRFPIRVPGRALRCRSMLLPTTIGRYRLVRGKDKGRHHIELWEEMAGDLIPRPPAGWDDLGHGGAFEQGRWAWGRERKSLVENSVACRTHFFGTQKNITLAVLKLAVLLISSWMMTTLLMCFLLLGPFVIGRLLFHVIRLPKSWMHDPTAFGLGCIFFLPLCQMIFYNVVGDAAVPFTKRIFIWAHEFRPPPFRKWIVLCLSTILFCGLSPLLVGSIVDIGVIKSASWFMMEDPCIDQMATFLDWILGIALLLMWTQLCRRGLEPQDIWQILNLAANAGNNRNFGNINRINAGGQVAETGLNNAHADGRNDDSRTWQGPHGRTERFLAVWKAAILEFEYDKIDPELMLDDFCVPMLRGLVSVLLLPLLLLGLFHLYPTAIVGWLRVILVRSLLFLSCAYQTGPVWLGHAKRLLDIAQKTARDDLYLIGEVLLSYSG